MTASMPLGPAPPDDPPASRRGTLVLNLALVVFAGAVILSNLLFFPLSPGANRRSVAERPAASAPVVVALPVPKQPSAPADPPPEQEAAMPPAIPAVPPAIPAVPPAIPAVPPAPQEPATAGTDDATVLQRIEPSAAPPTAKPHGTVAEPAPTPSQEVASLPPTSEPAQPPPPPVPPEAAAEPAPASPPQEVASLPPGNEPVAAPPPAPAVEIAAAPPAASPLAPEEIEALTRRGDALLLTGDIAAARFAFERAARAGSAAAATGVGKTFDPLFLAAAGVRGIQGNPFEAAAWYRRGSVAGDREAESRLRALHLQFPE